MRVCTLRSFQKRARVGVGLALGIVLIALAIAKFGQMVVLAVQFDWFTVVLYVSVIAARLEVLLLVLVAQHRAQVVHFGAELLGEQCAQLFGFLFQSVHHFDCWLAFMER